MPERQYQKLDKEYRQKDRLYPDRGRSSRPWEAPLREKIRTEIVEGLKGGHQWAKDAAQRWHIDPSTGQFLP